MKALLGRDPVALKELRGVSRRWQTYVGRCLYVGITAALLYQYWKDHWVTAVETKTDISISEYAALGRAIFDRCEWTSLVLTVLAAVIAGSEMIARETRAGTLGLLLLTPLTPHHVVLGKWKGAMMIAIALYLCSVPVLAIAVFLGGVGPVDLARSTLFTLGLAASAAAFGLYASARLSSAGAAVGATLAMLLGYFVGALAVDYLGGVFLLMMSGPGATLAHQGGVATSLLSFLTVILTINAAVRQVKIRTGAIPGPEVHARELRTLALDERREKRQSKSQRVLIGWRSVWEGNPLLWKEFTLRPALRIREDWRVRSYVLLYFLFLVSWVLTSYAGGSAFLPIWGTFFTLVALAGGCLLFAPEKEGRQWMLLLSTPVTPIDIVRAKLLCGLIFPEVLGLLVLYGLCLCVWLVGNLPMEVVASLGLSATVFLAFCYLLAAAASLRARTARTAFILSAGIVAFLVTIPALASAALRPTAGSGAGGWIAFWNWIEALDPVLVFRRFAVDHRFQLAPGALEGMFRFLILYLPVTLLLPVEMVLRFRKIANHA